MTPETARRNARTYLNAAAIRVDDAVRVLTDAGLTGEADEAWTISNTLTGLIRALTPKPKAVAS